MEIKITELEVQKLNVKPDEILFFKYKGNSIGEDLFRSLKNGLQLSFPNNKIALVMLPIDEDLEISTIKPE